MTKNLFERNLKLLLLVLLITILLIFPTYNSKLIKSFNSKQSTDWDNTPEAAITYPDIGVI